MAVDTSVIGKQTGAWRVALDRAVLANFAKAVGDTSRVYRDASRGAAGSTRPGAADVHVRARRTGARSPSDQPADPTGGRRTRCTRSWASCTRRARSCCTASRSSSTTARRSRGDVLDGVQTIIDIYEKETDARDDDVRRHGDVVDRRRRRRSRS